MKTIIQKLLLFVAMCIAASFALNAQNTNTISNNTKTTTMKTYVIERDIPGASAMTGVQLKAISQTSCNVLTEMGPKIQWLHSYVAGDKIYCIYKAESEELIREHAKKGGFPANKVTEVANVISPETAKQ